MRSIGSCATARIGIAVGDTLDTDYADDAVFLAKIPDQWSPALQRFDVEAGNMDLHTVHTVFKVSGNGRERCSHTSNF